AAHPRMITIRGTSDHHHLESVITIGWNDRSPSLECARAFNHDYTQDAREPRKQSSGSCAQAWPHNKRGHPAGGVSIAGRKASAWLSDNAVASNLSSPSIDCALPSLNRLTTFWFRIRSESSVA